MSSNIKPISGITSIGDLGLSQQYQILLNGHDPKDIVIAARQHKLTKFCGIASVRAARITSELITSGYVHAESTQSQRVRRLLIKADVIDNPNSTEEYESRVEFSTEQINLFLVFLSDTLTPREEQVIIWRFGLSGERPLTLDECRKEYGVHRERIRQIEEKALRKLRQPKQKRKLQEIFPESPIKIKPAQSSPYDRIPIEELDLSVRSSGCLSRANIQNISQLRQFRQKELLRIRNLGRKSLEEIVWKLEQLGITLEK